MVKSYKELQNFIDATITQKKEKGSITPMSHGAVLQEVLDFANEKGGANYSLIITDDATNTQPASVINEGYLNLVDTTNNVVVSSNKMIIGEGVYISYNTETGLQFNLQGIARTDTDTDTAFDNGIKVIESVTTNNKGQVIGTNKKILPNKDYVDNTISTAIADLGSALIFRGTLNSSITTETDTVKKYLPANHKIGDTWLVTKAGTYGGKSCEVGDMFVCTTTRTTANNSDWASIQANWTAIAGSESLYWDSTTTLATIGGVQIKAKMPPIPALVDTVVIGTLPRIRVGATATLETPFAPIGSVEFYEIINDRKQRIFIDYSIIPNSLVESIIVEPNVSITENTIECRITGKLLQQ